LSDFLVINSFAMKSAILLSSLLAGVLAQPPPHGCYIQTHETAYDLTPLTNVTRMANATDTYLNLVYNFQVTFCANSFKCGSSSTGSILGYEANKCDIYAIWPTNTNIYGNTSSDATSVEFQLAGKDGYFSRYYIWCDPNEHVVIDNAREDPQNTFNFFMRSRYVCDAYANNYQGTMTDLFSGAEYGIQVNFNADGQVYVNIEGDLRDGVLAAYYFDRQYQNYVGALVDTDNRENLGDMILRPIQGGERLDGTYYDKFENIYSITAMAQNN